MKKIIICISFLFTAVAASAAPITIQTPSGDRTLTAYDDGRVTYRSANGNLDLRVTKDGLEVGTFKLHATRVSFDGHSYKMHLEIGQTGKTQEDDIEANTDSQEIHGKNLGGIDKELDAFAKSCDGQLLQEAKALIATYQASNQNLGKHAITGQASFWGCTADVLGAVAAGATFVVGCGGGAAVCGPYAIHCCVGGAAWYGQSLIILATNTNGCQMV